MRRVRAGLLALVHLATGLGTAPVAGLLIVALVVFTVLWAVGVGFWLLPRVLRGVRSLADLERTRLVWVGHELVGPGELPRGLRAALADAALLREVVWLVPYATLGTFLRIVGLQLAGYAVQYTTAPAWWRLVPELTATRAAALDAHAVELRRIERSLHDGSQNRLVAVTVLIGAARRGLARDPAFADELLERAQSAAELALVELREVVRSVLPPC
ncbi:MAG: sensor domain-containing protein [Terracoccus sp.]